MFNSLLRRFLNKKFNEDYREVNRKTHSNDNLIKDFKARLDKTRISTGNLLTLFTEEFPFARLFRDYIEEFKPDLASTYAEVFGEMY